MHLESLLTEVGGFGPFQRRLVVIIALFKSAVVPTMLTMASAGMEPDWWCGSRENNTDLLYRNGSFRKCDWNATCDKQFDDVMVTVVSEWDLTCEKRWIANTITSIQMAGVLLGSMVSGYCSDAYGRKKMLYGGIFFGAVGNIAAANSVSWVMFAIIRFVLGVSIGFTLPVVYLYQVEYVETRYRGIIASLPSWGVGVVIYAGLAWGLQNWKWLCYVIAGGTAPLLLTWRFVPESIRWLTVKGRLDEARHVIARMAAANGKPMPDTSILSLIAEEERAQGIEKYSYLDLFRNRNLTRRTLLTCYMWFTLAVVYYAISFGLKDLGGNFHLNFMIMSLIELVSCLATLILIYIFSRRTATCLSLVSSMLACVGVAVANKIAPEDNRASLENGLAITAKFCIITGWGVALAFTSEQFPTVIRNLAFAAQNTSARVGGILAAQLLSLGSKNDLMPPFLAMAALACLTAGVCFTLEETGKKALEDTLKTYMTDVTIDVKEGDVQQVLVNTPEKTDRQTEGPQSNGVSAVDVHIKSAHCKEKTQSQTTD